MHSHGPAVPAGNGNLILSRIVGEQIMIGDNIIIHLVEIRGDKAKIAVSAPRSLPVHRAEIYNAINKNKK